MLKLTHVKFLAVGSMLLLAACSGAQASPVEEAPVEAEVVQPDKAEMTAKTDETMQETEAVVEEPVTVIEDDAMEETAAEETMAETKTNKKDTMTEEIVSTEAEVASEEAMAASEEEAMPVAEIVADQGPTEAQQQLLASLPAKGVPPELTNEVWLNADPTKLADLHGKVVLVEFWTFGCINCKNVIPSLREWHQEYEDDGLVIIGIHTPEFSYEKDVENVKAALVDLDVQYAVAIDNDWKTWRDYKKPFNQRYWPTKYFIDKTGQVRHIHIGEGRYDEQKEIIQALLAEQPVS
jgi:thiol-disulfide isomerase/thioredoxin